MSDEMKAGRELDERVTEIMEPKPAPITAREARKQRPNFQWYSCIDIHSPEGWWAAEIGTDHGPETADDDPVRWRPAREPSEDIAAAWEVVEKMRDRGWLFHVLAMIDGYVVNGREYKLPADGNWGNSMLADGLVQEPGDTAPHAICLAALAVMEEMARRNW